MSRFPPTTARHREIDALLEPYASVIDGKTAWYVSSPITSGRRTVEWYDRVGKDVNRTHADHIEDFQVNVIEANRRDASQFVESLRRETARNIIDPTRVGDLPDWDQNDYHVFWGRVIERFVETVIFRDGWQFSNGCAYELLISVQTGATILDERLAPLPAEEARCLLETAAVETAGRGHDASVLRGVLNAIATRSDSLWHRSIEPSPLKDDVLDELAEHANVAQFVSFGPGGTSEVRHVRIAGDTDERPSANELIACLLERSPDHAVNVRSFLPYQSKSNEFIYGLSRVDDVLSAVSRLSQTGHYTIVNELVDVADGGVSGVSYAGVVEFAPGDTPRCVEKPGTTALPWPMAMSIFETVYGFVPSLKYPDAARVEFSLHPLRRGYRHEHTIIWEQEWAPTPTLTADVRWPSLFSEFLGDKVFGLLVAHASGLHVPATTVMSRAVAPFAFGTSTETGEHWVRTAPRRPEPGKFTTARGWRDPFALLNAEDSKGDAIASVLAQEGVSSVYSGAAIVGPDDVLMIEGVKGFGDTFMQGGAPPDRLPPEIVSDVTSTNEFIRHRLGHARFEWAHDGRAVWVLQLHQGATTTVGRTIYPGVAEQMHRFQVESGIDELRRLISAVGNTGDGIVVVGSVGVTSHFGDLLRRAQIPSWIEDEPGRSPDPH